MNTNLTITIKEAVIVKAKKYARSKNSSLSNLIENYLKALIEEDKKEEIQTTSIVKSLQGSFKTPKNLDFNADLSNRLTEKYL